MILHVRVKPNSKIDHLSFDREGQFTVKIKAPAQDGRANEYLVKFLAKSLGISSSQIRLVSGFTNPHKKLEIDTDERSLQSVLEQFR